MKKLSSGRYDIPPHAPAGKIPVLAPCLSLKNIFFIELQSIFCAFNISIHEELSILERSKAVSQVIFLISYNVAFLYSGIIKNKNLGATF